VTPGVAVDVRFVAIDQKFVKAGWNIRSIQASRLTEEAKGDSGFRHPVITIEIKSKKWV
jgi:hypothetical protein